MSATPSPRPEQTPQLTTPAGSTSADLSKAPLPTAATLRKRRSLPLQAARFVVFNARMMRMVLKGHSST
ncbi:MAG TPA: hypothetical protein GXZ60_00040 [Intrasporangiaceae bacterium]|nr:hypothetical protein [Intrasporangiaceae bacterium]